MEMEPVDVDRVLERTEPFELFVKSRLGLGTHSGTGRLGFQRVFVRDGAPDTADKRG